MHHRQARTWLLVAAMAGGGLFAPSATAGDAAGPDAHRHGQLGSVEFPVSCAVEAGAEIERAVALLHHMTYPQAREGFERAAAADPGCAMAHWGVAMSLFQPLWPNRPGPEALERGRQAVARAESLAPDSARERLYIAAAGEFFRDPEADYWQRIRRWERGQEALHRAHPDDRDAAAFYALALLATAPLAERALDHHERAAELLRGIYEESPAHPGALHYTIHANDIDGRAGESLEIVRSYSRIAPANPHALHMPTHIFVRLGSWQEVIDGNRKAAAAALAHPAGDRGQHVWDEYPHAVEYLVYAALQQGDEAAAIGEWQRLHRTEDLQPTFKTAFHLASIPARLALERRAWAEAAALAPREPGWLDWDRFPWPEAVTWFARGVGAARGGDPASAARALGAIERLRDRASAAGEAQFAREIEILRLGVAAWHAQAEGRPGAALDLMREAVRLQEATPKHPVTPAPTLPAQELLADLLLELGRPAEALEAYARSLRSRPGRANSLAGAARAVAELRPVQRVAAGGGG